MRCVIIARIPAPYRLHLYDALARELASRGHQLHVIYSGTSEYGRYWEVDLSKAHFTFEVLPGWYFRVGGVNLRVNRFVGARLDAAAPDAVVVGNYLQPTSQMAKRWCHRRGVPSLLWHESNPLSSRHRGVASRLTRRLLMRGFDGVVVPGDGALASLRDAGIRVHEDRTIVVPNVIDEKRFVESVKMTGSRRDEIRESLAVSPDLQLWLMVCRLEREKGVRGFIDELKNVEGVVCLVAGTGSLYDALIRASREARLPVRFLGHKTEDEIVELLAAADCFVLPSIRDPSPLAAVEAVAAGLPLLMSTRVGNVWDVLIEGVNGHAFDPGNPSSVKHAIEAMLSHDHSDLFEMGCASRERHQEAFSTAMTASRFADGLEAIANLR
ncbi:MAG: glycosyltransferase family 4 protein [Actinomycetota bacterium]